MTTRPGDPADLAPARATALGAVPTGGIAVPAASSRIDRLRGEIRDHLFGYAVLAAFAAAGPLVAHFLFPEAPAGVGFIGGLAFGAYAALCAVPQKFL